MKNLTELNNYRTTRGVDATPQDATDYGQFVIPLNRSGKTLMVCRASPALTEDEADPDAEWGIHALPWEHVSIHVRYASKHTGKKWRTKTPTWDEMHLARLLFFKHDETVLQIHPPTKNYSNAHPNVLHLWRHTGPKIQFPPSSTIGPLFPSNIKIPAHIKLIDPLIEP